jgi:hypothetical protein
VSARTWGFKSPSDTLSDQQLCTQRLRRSAGVEAPCQWFVNPLKEEPVSELVSMEAARVERLA